MDQLAIDEWLAPHEPDQQIALWRGVGDQPIDGLPGHVLRHRPGPPAELSLVGVAIATGHVAALRNIQRQRFNRWRLDRFGPDVTPPFGPY